MKRSISLNFSLLGIVLVPLLFGTCAAERAGLASPTYTDPGVIFVKGGDDLQVALDRAVPGDTIKLEARATFEGSFVLPKKTGETFITITTSAADLLPATGERIDPSKHLPAFPRLMPSGNEPVIRTSAGSHHYRFVGVEFGGTKDGVGNIIQIGTASERTVDDIPHHIEFDRVYIHSTSPLGQRRGIAANGRHIKIVNSNISNIKRKGDRKSVV